MSDTTKIRLWLIRDRPEEKARFYSKLPPERSPEKQDMIWVPRSLIEHCTKRGAEHELTLPDWFIQKNNL